MDETAIRRRFAEMETETLLALWEREERVATAERALRRELVERGFDEADLTEIVALRPAIADAQVPSENAGDRVASRLAFMLAAAVLGFGLGKLFGARVGALAAVFVGCSFVTHTLRDLLKPRHTDVVDVLFMVHEGITLLTVVGACILGIRFVTLGHL